MLTGDSGQINLSFISKLSLKGSCKKTIESENLIKRLKHIIYAYVISIRKIIITFKYIF